MMTIARTGPQRFAPLCVAIAFAVALTTEAFTAKAVAQQFQGGYPNTQQNPQPTRQTTSPQYGQQNPAAQNTGQRFQGQQYSGQPAQNQVRPTGQPQPTGQARPTGQVRPTGVQNQGAPQRVATRQTGPAPIARQPQPPFPPLSAKHQQYLDKVLQFWEYKSKQIKHYECRFRRWEYDPVWGPRQDHKTYSTGVIKYAEPDKGLFEVSKVYHYNAPTEQGGKPQYNSVPGEVGEKWICDGTTVFQFDADHKQLIETTLPPEMQGKAIVNGPLPFMFGADAQKIKARYWVRIVTPKGAKNEYWIEAFPKFREDAANFQRIEVIIDGTDYLPKAIQVYPPSYNEQTNPSRTVYMFDNRVVNSLMNKLSELNLWSKAFFRPNTPSGWERITRNYNEEPQPTAPVRPAGSAGAAPPATATRQGPYNRR